VSTQQQLDSGVDRDEDALTKACPECDSARSIRQRQQREPPWICYRCNSTFQKPFRRRVKHSPDWNLSELQVFLLACPSDASLDELADLYEQYERGEL
jgi:ribosomal protein L37AE/L43A